ncbi:hypothetical protein RJ639_013952 [Escallonia herrerae]|uniref:cellulase n=1 Tax=Escallonia herrerae TaxID=1293975 RepID=A0AA89AP66_9ASTE|nr:hypothetical protein RJ639_013952 [Escallonia herrerae]
MGTMKSTPKSKTFPYLSRPNSQAKGGEVTTYPKDDLEEGLSALHDGFDQGVDLLGGYYDAGDNVKFNFPMAFTTTMLAWSVLEFGDFMDADLQHAVEAIRWATDYFLKATSVNGSVFVQVGDPWADHNCWERPEDMDTPRTSFAVTAENPGSEVLGK